MNWSCERRRGDGGFTLLEVLVALAIAGLALAVLSDATSGGILAAHTAASYDEAVSRAKSHLASLTSGPLPAPGSADGEDGSGYHWRYVIKEAGQHQGRGIATMTLYDIEVGIAWNAAGHRREVVLYSQRMERVRGRPNG